MFATLWNNPFTTATGAAAAISGILHALGVNLPIDTGTLSLVLTAITGFFAKDGTAAAK